MPIQAVAGDRSGAVPDALAALKPGAIWQGFWAEPWSFKWTCLYVFFEYVRPQQIYGWLQGPPWALLCISAAVLCFVLEGLRFRSKTLLNWAIAAFSVIVLLSSIFAEYPEISISKLNNFANWIIAFVLIANSASNERRWFLFIALFLLWNTKMSQHGLRSFMIGSWGNGGAPGWFQNSGEFALEMCLFFPISFHFILALAPRLTKKKLLLLTFLPVSAVLSVIAAGSRGGQLALACVGLFLLLRSKQKLRGMLLVLIVAPVTWLAIPQGQKSRFQQSGTDDTSLARIEYWKAGREMASAFPFLGVGYENWVPYYGTHYVAKSQKVKRLNVRGEEVVEVSHNSFIEVMSQLGYTGLVFFLALMTSIWYVNYRTRALLNDLGERGRFIRHMSFGLDAGVIGFAVAGFFMAVAFYPFLWFQLAMTGGLHAAAQSLARSPNAQPSTPTSSPVSRPSAFRSRNPHARPRGALYAGGRNQIAPRPRAG